MAKNDNKDFFHLFWICSSFQTYLKLSITRIEQQIEQKIIAQKL